MQRHLGLDVHAQSCTLAVISEAGQRLKDVVIETNGQALIEAIRLIPGHKHLCLEEGTQSAWLYEILEPHVDELVVVSARGERGQKSDKIDAYARAEELRRGMLGPRVFKAPKSFALLRELAKGHLLIGRDVVRIQVRLKSVYRSRGIPTPGASVYGTRERQGWLERLPLPSRRRAQGLYAQLDFRVEHKQRAQAERIEELAQHSIARVLRTGPGLGPIRVARLLSISIVVTPHRFRTRQQFWSYCFVRRPASAKPATMIAPPPDAKPVERFITRWERFYNPRRRRRWTPRAAGWYGRPPCAGCGSAWRRISLPRISLPRAWAWLPLPRHRTTTKTPSSPSSWPIR